MPMMAASTVSSNSRRGGVTQPTYRMTMYLREARLPRPGRGCDRNPSERQKMFAGSLPQPSQPSAASTGGADGADALDGGGLGLGDDHVLVGHHPEAAASPIE